MISKNDFLLDCTADGNFECGSSGLCLPKYVLDNCYERLETDCIPSKVGPCNRNPCGDNGICYEGLNTFYCGCKPGWKGTTCETESK